MGREDKEGTCVSIFLGASAVSLYAFYKAISFTLAGIVLLCTVSVLYKNGVFNKLASTLDFYVHELGNTAKSAIETLKVDLNKALKKAKDKPKTKKLIITILLQKTTEELRSPEAYEKNTLT